MEALSDDDYEKVSDIDLSEYDSDSDDEKIGLDSPSSSPPSVRTIRTSDRKKIPCSYPSCPKTFNRKCRLEEHLRSHTNERIFKCTHKGCGKDFLRDTHLKHHLKSAHSDVRDYKCTWEGCDKSFATGTRLRRHFQAHEGREKYRCRGYEGCDQTFRKHDTLRKHVMQVHEQMRPFPCPDEDPKTGRQCDKAFDTAEKLRTHQRAKHDRSRFSCTECLSRNAQMAKSISALTTEQFDACFATYSDLQAHIAEFHPPTCPHCFLVVTTSKELTQHLEIQHGISNPNAPKAETHYCTFSGCNRSFTKRGNLSVHIKTVHENKREFVCGYTEIPTPQGLNAHGPVAVSGCGRAFTTKASLEDHVRTAHLGMTSLQMERRNKRKAEKQDLNDSEIDPKPKTRRARKDKGVKKVTLLETLTTAPAPSQEQTVLPLDPALANPYAASRSVSIHDTSSQDDIKVESEDDDDDDDWNQLSGSMTMLGTRLYHNGEEYEYNSSGYPSGFVPQLTEGFQSSSQHSNAGYSRVSSGVASTLDDEPFFDNFEHEPETIEDAPETLEQVLRINV